MFDVAMYCGSYGLLFTLGLTLGRTRTERTASSGDAAAGTVDGGGMWRRVPMPDWLAARYERCPVIYSHYAVANPHNACVSASLALEIEDRRCRECPRVTDLFFEEEVRSEDGRKRRASVGKNTPPVVVSFCLVRVRPVSRFGQVRLRPVLHAYVRIHGLRGTRAQNEGGTRPPPFSHHG